MCISSIRRQSVLDSVCASVKKKRSHQMWVSISPICESSSESINMVLALDSNTHLWHTNANILGDGAYQCIKYLHYTKWDWLKLLRGWISLLLLCERVFERTQSNWIPYTVMLLRHLTIDMVRFLPLMDPIYALSTHKCARISNALFFALSSISFFSHTHASTYLYRNIKPFSVCRLVCNSPKPSVDAVATTELVFFALATISTYLCVYWVSQCFQCFFNVNDLPTFFLSFLFTLARTAAHHIT